MADKVLLFLFILLFHCEESLFGLVCFFQNFWVLHFSVSLKAWRGELRLSDSFICGGE